ncbi:UNVERIFIED_CONTAM: hypothetical protein GTU68_063025 [Idotea baltica]|nr:hypothetical protein [Idotea baltica]
MMLYSEQGPPIMDLISGIGVSAIGHCHPKVVKAVQEQAATFMHTMVYGEFVLSPQVLLAEALCTLLPPELNSVYFVNSGAEAVEGALKLAKRVTGRYEIIACKKSYHGSTYGAMSLMSEATFTQPFAPVLPGIKFIDFNSLPDLDQITNRTAAVIVETVQGESGLQLPDPKYLKALASKCKEVKAMLILDEIQCGFGRTGHMFAFSQFGIKPDILLLAKALGGGMPIGAFISAREHMSTLSHNPALGHITTFGGHPVNCAAGLANLQVFHQEGLVENVAEKAKKFAELLPHPLIKEIRQAGLWFALDLKDPIVLQKAVHLGLERGLLFDWFLFNDHSIRIAPPLIITMAEIEIACETLHEIFDSLMDAAVL